MSDDKPAIEYHPFGTATVNFDEGPVKLRRPRLGDLEFARNYMEELRLEHSPTTTGLTDELKALDIPEGETVPDEEMGDRFKALNGILNRLTDVRREFVYKWLSAVMERMGDNQFPVKEEWPLALFDAYPVVLSDEDTEGRRRSGMSVVVADLLNHWQNRPLSSGRISQNGMIPAADNAEPSKVSPSSPPAQL